MSESLPPQETASQSGDLAEIEESFAPQPHHLEVSPSVVEFAWEPETTLETTLQLKNLSALPMAFKIKTTAPKAYLVRPSTGVMEVNGSFEIMLVHQPVKEKPNNNSDRFLIQYLNVNTTTPLSKAAWAKIPKSNYRDRRLFVRFAAPEIEVGSEKRSLETAEAMSPKKAEVKMMEHEGREERTQEHLIEIDRLRKAVAEMSASKGVSSKIPTERAQNRSFIIALLLVGALIGIFVDRILFPSSA